MGVVGAIIFLAIILGGFFRLAPAVKAASLEEFQADLDFLRNNAVATLLFNPFGDNPDSRFERHHLTEEQIRRLCRNVPCEGMGNNTASLFTELRKDRSYAASERLGMEYMLEISGIGNVAQAGNRINEEDGIFKIIVRFGVGSDGLGLDSNPQSLISLLRNLSAAAKGTEFLAIAGPNEPDLEDWWQPTGNINGKQCGVFNSSASVDEKQKWYDCVGPLLANYMNTICAAKARGDIPANVKLLSPAFNFTSESFKPLYTSMIKAGAQLETGNCLEGIAGNLYPAGASAETFWVNQDLDSISKDIYITETGPWESIPALDDGSTGSAYNPTKDKEITGAIYLSPILDVFPKESRDVGKIRDSLINQGYQAYCATPTYTIEPKVTGAVEIFLDNVRAGYYSGATLDVGSTQIIDYTEAQTPIFRDTDRKRKLKADLEEYFGFKQVQPTDNYGQVEVQSSAINSLLSEAQKCVQTANTLHAQQVMCDKLNKPEQCALYASQVPGTDYTVLSLLRDYEAFAGIRSDRVEVCKEIVINKGGEKLRTGMVNASTHLERASRIAFLVAAVAQKPVVDNMLFNFFSHSDKAEPKDEVLMVAFRIPDIGTNKGSVWESSTMVGAGGNELYPIVKRDDLGDKVEAVESGHTFWDDAMNLTRNVLIPRKTAERLDLEGSEYRTELRSAAATATNQSASSLIYCLQGQAPDGTGSQTCNDEVVKAVVDVINATWEYDKERVSCDNLTVDEVDEIGEPAKVDKAGDTTWFQGDYGDYILDNIWHTDITSQKFSSLLKVNLNTWPPKDCVVLDQGKGAEGDCTTINFYLVYPMGYDLETLEYVMSRTFLTEDQFEQYENDPNIKERFNIFDDRVELESETDEYRFKDYTNCEWEGSQYVCPDEEFEGKVQSSQGPALFFGGRLGFWVREIQKIFTRVDSLAYKYLENCRSTEEFLLDQCGGKPGSRTFDDKYYCSDNGKTNIVRDVQTTELSRFKFFYGNPEYPDDESNTIPDEENSFFPKPGDRACTFKMSVRAVDSLTLILSGGKDIIPNNPGNIIGCVGTQSISSKVRIRRLPPEAGPPAPDPEDPRWDTAESMRTTGGSAAQIEYNLKLTPGYYRFETKVNNSICLSNVTWAMDNRKKIFQNGQWVDNPNYPYYFIDKVLPGAVIDLTSDQECAAGACVDYNFQSAMQGGGPVYKEEDGKQVVDYVIDIANEFLKDSLGCDLTFEYSTLTWNNACGGGRSHGCSDPEGTIGGNCGFWSSFVNSLNSGKAKDLWLKGYEAYKSVYGRKLVTPKGNFNCTHERAGLDDPVFSNTISLYNCESYSNSLDSLRIFGKVVGFQIEWYKGNRLIQMPIPPRQLWDAIVSASERHGCDRWLMLALASSEGPEGTYLNEPIQNWPGALGFFKFTEGMWNFWKTPDANGTTQCAKVQPTTFDPSMVNVDFSNMQSNIDAQVDTACRAILYSGAQKYPENTDAFRNAFYSPANPPENSYDKGWDWNQLVSGEDQAGYVWRFWKLARESAKEQPQTQPAGYPPSICPAGTVLPDRGQTGNLPASGDIPAWKLFINYNQATTLPSQGIATYYNPGVMNTNLQNRILLNQQINQGLINNCELTNPNAGSTIERWTQAQQLASSNGSKQVVGCAAMFRLGDVPFVQTGNKNDIRLVWVKVSKGPLSGTPIGPIGVVDVIAENHIEERYNRDKGRWIIDLDYSTFRMLYDFNPNTWNDKQEITVCDTEAQCQ